MGRWTVRKWLPAIGAIALFASLFAHATWVPRALLPVVLLVSANGLFCVARKRGMDFNDALCTASGGVIAWMIAGGLLVNEAPGGLSSKALGAVVACLGLASTAAELTTGKDKYVHGTLLPKLTRAGRFEIVLLPVIGIAVLVSALGLSRHTEQRWLHTGVTEMYVTGGSPRSIEVANHDVSAHSYLLVETSDGLSTSSPFALAPQQHWDAPVGAAGNGPLYAFLYNVDGSDRTLVDHLILGSQYVESKTDGQPQ